MKQFVESLEIVPKALAKNAGVKATEVLSKLCAAHHKRRVNAGVDIEAEGAAVLDSV